MAEFNFQSFRDALVAAFWRIGYRVQDSVKVVRQGVQNVGNNNEGAGIMYPPRFYNFDAMIGSWVELARSPNNVQDNDNQSVSHDFVANGENLEYQISAGDKKIIQPLKVETDNSKVTFKGASGNLFGDATPITVVAVFDDQLNAAVDPRRQQYAYVVLSQGNKVWILARKGVRKNPVAARQLINYVKRMGYNVTIYHPQLNVSQQQQAKPQQQEPQAKPQQQEPQAKPQQQEPQAKPQQQEPQAKPQQQEPQQQTSQTEDLVIPWTASAFPPNGAGREIHVPSGWTLRFVSPKDETHTVAQALVEEVVDEDSGKKYKAWKLHPQPVILSPPEQVGFNRTLTIYDPGVYYLICPVGRNHQLIRLKLIVHDKNYCRRP
jgi:lipocalin